MNSPHIVYSTSSWHYRLIVYIFSAEFFLETDGFDYQAMDSVSMEKHFKIIYKKKPRTVNLCPYCRAVVGAVIMLPFIILWRLFPHKEKIRTHQEIIKRSQRNSRIAQYITASGMAGFGMWNLSTENYFLAVFYFGLAFFNLFSVRIFKWIATRLPKKEFKAKPIKKLKVSSKIVKTITEKHDLICPPIFFIDTTANETIR